MKLFLDLAICFHVQLMLHKPRELFLYDLSNVTLKIKNVGIMYISPDQS